MNHISRSQVFARRARLPFIATIVASALCLSMAFASPASATRVFIDPGHGGPYPGAVQGGVAEEYVNLLIGLELSRELESRGIDTALSRTRDTSPGLRDRGTWHYVDSGVRYYADGQTGIYKYDPNQTGSIPYDDLQARCDKANEWGADIFISIHCDSVGSSSARGTSTYRNWDNKTDKILSNRLATLVQTEMIAETSPTYNVQNDGVNVVGFYVVRWSNMPSILIESAFLSNSYERGLLLNPWFRARLADGIADGVERFMAEDPFKPLWDRRYGATRYETATEIAREGWPDGAETVLLASGENWPDALAATPLSMALDAPLLLTAKSGLSSATRHALAELAPSEIIVLGGEAALLSTTTVQAGAAAGLEQDAVRRIAGANRYETAALIAEEVGIPESGRVVLVSGASFADALSVSASAGASGEPILLTQKSALPTSVGSFLLAHDEEISSAWVIGGTAVITEELASAVKAGSLGFGPKAVTRTAGVNRYATNIAVLNAMFPGELEPYVATGVKFPDALSAGTLAAREGRPIMLLGGRYMSPYTREFLINEEERLADFTIIGGPGALPYLMDWEIEKGLAR